ncbi:hypothetical protein EI555_017723 [Monodon monoceros]|uniref:Ubiquitin-like domain-containing protein n=1 Tax=Monodon monoceros TaxID=40151 RepID=A0A4U1FBL7_MONMO|nr:hypothetical protein EI555_017723 [Monodon monoceros]
MAASSSSHPVPRTPCAAAPAHRGEAAAAVMDVFHVIWRHKPTIFTDAKESSTVFELKRIVEGILKRLPEEQRLY